MTNRKHQSGSVFIQCMSLWKYRGLTPFFGYPFLYRTETLKATDCGLNWLLPVITKMFNIHVYIQECVEWNLSEGQRNTRCAVNTGQAWWKQELKSIDCDQLQLLLLSLSQRVQTHRYYKAGCREGRGCCGNGRLHLMSEDDEGDSCLWIWGDAAHRQRNGICLWKLESEHDPFIQQKSFWLSSNRQ